MSDKKALDLTVAELSDLMDEDNRKQFGKVISDVSRKMVARRRNLIRRGEVTLTEVTSDKTLKLAEELFIIGARLQSDSPVVRSLRQAIADKMDDSLRRKDR